MERLANQILNDQGVWTLRALALLCVLPRVLKLLSGPLDFSTG